MNRILRFLCLFIPAIAFGGATSSIIYPIGQIAPAPMDGGTWLQMNGQVQLQATYPTLFSIIGHRPQFTWTIVPQGQIAAAATVDAVAFGAGVYVAVCNNGAIYSSPDLITWTSRTSGVATSLNDVAWDAGNTLFVTVGASNVILTSPDGTTWTSRTSGVTSTLARVMVANSETVAIGTAGWVTHSANDTSWTAVQPNSGDALFYLFYVNTVWFACPNISFASGIVYSTDGTTFNHVAKPTTNNSVFLGADATNFYIGDATNGQIFKSTTGASWASVTIPNNYTTAATPAVFFSGRLGTVVVPASFSAGPSIQGGYTTDGFATFHQFKATTDAGGVWVPYIPMAAPTATAAQNFIIAQSINANYGLSYSADGISWTADASASGAVSGFNVPHFANGYYFLRSAVAQSTLMYAPEPYNPTTQFQIPTNAPTGTALYIKAK